MSDQTALLSIDSLDVYYGDLHALHNVSLGVERGEVLALIGPSGCGKSALLRALNRMSGETAHIDGTVRLNGRDIYREMDQFELRRRVGMIFSRPNTFPFSIFDNVAFGPRMQGERNRARLVETVEHALVEAELWSEVRDRLHKPALRLSEGQQQRLCIARALALQPEVLLMDEPTSSLDPIATGRIEQLLEHLKQRVSILLVTHAVQQASRVSDSTAFFLMGGLIEYNRTSRLFMQPERRETADYISGRYV